MGGKEAPHPRASAQPPVATISAIPSTEILGYLRCRGECNGRWRQCSVGWSGLTYRPRFVACAHSPSAPRRAGRVAIQRMLGLLTSRGDVPTCSSMRWSQVIPAIWSPHGWAAGRMV